ncbi:MAG: hypothetical protein WCA80_12745 [Candidatus Aquilonibacter sp.]
MEATQHRGVLTYLALKPGEIQTAFNYFSNNVWNKTHQEWSTLCGQVGAHDLDFSIICDNVVQRLDIRIWAQNSPKAVRDKVCEIKSGFWKDFHDNLDKCLPTPLADQACIL